MKKQFLAALICLFMVSGCAAKDDTAAIETIRNIKTISVGESDYVEKLTISGTVVPVETVKLSFKVSGNVNEVLVKEGDAVTQGQVIARLDKGDYDISKKAAQAQVAGAASSENAALAGIEGAKAQLETANVQIKTEIPTKINQAKAKLDLTQTNYDRVKEMVDQGVAPKSMLDDVTAQLEVDKNTYQQALDANEVAETKRQQALAQLEASKAQYEAYGFQTQAASAALELADSNLGDTTITSPMNGIVLQKIVQSGEVTSAGYPIVTIGSIDKVWVEIGVTDETINLLQKGQRASVFVYGIDKSVEGIVDEVGSLADASTRTFPVRILVENSASLLKPGMVCKVDVSMGDSIKTLVPISSVITLSDGSAVFVYDEKTKTVSKRYVEAGEIAGDKIEVLSGLNHGEKLVVEGQYVLHDGEKVLVQKEGEDNAAIVGEMGQ